VRSVVVAGLAAGWIGSSIYSECTASLVGGGGPTIVSLPGAPPPCVGVRNAGLPCMAGHSGPGTEN
jgi:hypothetical protein